MYMQDGALTCIPRVRKSPLRRTRSRWGSNRGSLVSESGSAASLKHAGERSQAYQPSGMSICRDIIYQVNQLVWCTLLHYCYAKRPCNEIIQTLRNNNNNPPPPKIAYLCAIHPYLPMLWAMYRRLSTNRDKSMLYYQPWERALHTNSFLIQNTCPPPLAVFSLH